MHPFQRKNCGKVLCKIRTVAIIQLMASNQQLVRTYFTKLGFENEIADIYLSLYSLGPQNVSQLSRNARIERTRIYRLIDDLLASQLIAVESHSSRALLQAAPISNLQSLIIQRRQEADELEDGLQLLEKALRQNSITTPQANIVARHGAAATEFLAQQLASVEYCLLGSAGIDFVVSQIQTQHNSSAPLTCPILSNEKIVFDATVGNNHDNQAHSVIEQRHNDHYVLPKTLFTIQESMFITGDTTILLTTVNGDTQLLSIRNQSLAISNKQLCIMLLSQAASK